MLNNNEVFTTTIKDYLNSGGYLPDPLKDFHDQKQFFKYLQNQYGVNGRALPCASNDIGWPDGTCYTIDYFLHFMARFGYKLQRDRTNIEFRDIREELETFRTQQAEEFRKAIS